MFFVSILGWLFSALALTGTAYALLSVYCLRRFARGALSDEAVFPPVTLLKPLHGDEPGLQANLEGYFHQDYPAPVQLVFGVQDPRDGAIAVVERLKERHPGADVTLVIDGRHHGTNPKISNLLNMVGAARHRLLVLSDSDIGVDSNYLRVNAAALSPKEVGAVTWVYTGWAAAGPGSRFSAMGINYQFLPNVVSGLALGMAKPCFGSTIAIQQDVLAEIGGLKAFANHLADDYEVGRAVRAKGYKVSIPPYAVRHACTERTVRDWLHHELRWQRTIRTADAVGHLGSIVTYPLALALIAVLLSGASPLALGVIGLAVGVRAWVKYTADHVFALPPMGLVEFYVRDVISFYVFVISLFGGVIIWQDKRLHVRADGAVSKY